MAANVICYCKTYKQTSSLRYELLESAEEN